MRRVAKLLVSLALLATIPAMPANAAAPKKLFQAPSGSVTPGSEAGQLNNPRSMVADPDTGHLYVTELDNSRISEFTAWGIFVKAWGWDVAPEGAPGDTVSNQFEICTTSCRAGSNGNGAGQFHNPLGIALDSNGDLYVYEFNNRRVQKFSPSGQFLLMFGGGVNQGPTNPGNLCTAQHITEGDTCGAGTSGTADGEFSNATSSNYITYNPVTDTVFVGDKDRIQEFGIDGKFEGKVDFEGELEAFDGKSIQALAADPVSGDLYVSFPDPGLFNEEPNIYRIDLQTNEVIDVLEVEAPGAIAVDAAGNVYAIERPNALFGYPGFEVLGFDPAGNPISGMSSGDEFAKPEFPHVPGGGPDNASDLTGIGVNLCEGSQMPGNLFVTRTLTGHFMPRSYFSAYGTPPIGCEPPPSVPPDVEDQFAISVDTDGAVVKASINPHFWADTTYHVQYGTEPCSKGGCQSQPASPGRRLTEEVLDGSMETSGVFLGGLKSGTTYRYRFVARSGGSEGNEVFGEERSFKTFAVPSSAADSCANRSLRSGQSAKLPDCRAYEMVSPLDKNNGDIVAAANSNGLTSGYFASADTGERVTYSSERSFAKSASAQYTSQYLAVRHPLGQSDEGWSTEAISSPATRRILPIGSSTFTPYKAFSPDLCTAWLRTAHDPPLTGGAVAGFANIYRRDNCGAGAGSFEAVTQVTPPNVDPEQFYTLELQGTSSAGSHAIYVAPDNLVEGTPAQPGECLGKGSGCQLRLYEYVAGEGLRYVCILPNGKATKQPCTAGTLEDASGSGMFSNLHNAISSDGERIFWSDSSSGPGRIYVRIGGSETLDVSKSAEALSKASGSQFWTAAADGTAAVFTIGELEKGAATLYFVEVDSETTVPIAKSVLGLLGASEDAKRIYFASTEAIAGTGQNSEKDEALSGKPNLYLWERDPGETRFVGTLEIADSISLKTFPSPVATEPRLRSSRVTSDGMNAAFMSTASLTGYDNTDAHSGEPNAEVFLYDAAANGGDGRLACVSCNPSGARPSGEPLLVKNGLPTPVWAAARIPGCVSPNGYCGWERSLHASRALSDKGDRLFFESHEALVSRDANGAQDVYQWEKAGMGGCDVSDASFVEDSGGCVDLISSGESPRDSSFVDASASGDDVFITTLSSLLPQDYGLVDLYDARVGGGFPPPPPPAVTCEGEACQGPLSAPDDPTPASSSFEGAGNLTESLDPAKCAKGRRAVRKAGRIRCIRKPHRKKRQNRQNPHQRKGQDFHHRRAGQ